MALQLMKIQVLATGDIDVNPTTQRFFYVTDAPTPIGDTLTIDAAEFFNDLGDPVVELPALAANNSTYNVYINGVLQMANLSTYTPGITAVGSLVIDLPEDQGPILVGTPIVLQIVTFAPSTNIDIET